MIDLEKLVRVEQVDDDNSDLLGIFVGDVCVEAIERAREHVAKNGAALLRAALADVFADVRRQALEEAADKVLGATRYLSYSAHYAELVIRVRGVAGRIRALTDRVPLGFVDADDLRRP